VVASLVWLAGLSFVLKGGNFTEEFPAALLLHLAAALWGFTGVRPVSVWVYVALGLAMGCTFMLRPNNIGLRSPSAGR
jgi:hypothetical protein